MEEKMVRQLLLELLEEKPGLRRKQLIERCIGRMGFDAEQLMSVDELLAFLKKRIGILEGVCITGGEPTLNPELIPLLKSIKELGYKTKLDTNGYRPDVLREVVENRLADYVAMDIKNAPDRYGYTAGLDEFSVGTIEGSIRILTQDVVDHEFRTTVVKPLHDRDAVSAMGSWMSSVTGGKKVSRWFIQPFVDRDTVPVAGLAAPDADELADFVNLLSPYTEYISLRGV